MAAGVTRAQVAIVEIHGPSAHQAEQVAAEQAEFVIQGAVALVQALARCTASRLQAIIWSASASRVSRSAAVRDLLFRRPAPRPCRAPACRR